MSDFGQYYFGGVMASVFALSMEDLEFDPQSSQTKEYKIDFCYFSAKQEAKRSERKDWFARNQRNVSEWSDNYTVVSFS